MGSKNKLKRFKENLSFNNLFQPTRSELLSNSFKYKGFWKDYFKNNNPIVLELGCGKGEYTCSLAEKYPKKNFIGIDIKGARIWSGAKYAVVNSIENACFIRTQIELIECLFSENEISEIWITFPDPQIKIQRQKHRLTNINFLNRYKKIIKSKGIIHLKTDSEFLHGYTLGLIEALNLKLIQSNHDIYLNQNAPEEVVDIKTHYEKIFLAENKKITYLSFQIK
ncbi:MAG: tRNA (guanosine(46)-N7)-methyltransferase TrmB [Flavobacteriaceae bacterium]